MLTSPYQPLVSGHNLPIAYQNQFLLSPEDGRYIEIRGRMSRVWNRPAFLRPALWLMAHMNALFPEQGENIPTTVTITAHRDKDGQPYHRWQRRFDFPNTTRHFESFHRYDPTHNCIIEAQGPGRMVEAHYRLNFIDGGHFTFDSLFGAVRFAGLTIRLPNWAWVTLDAEQWLDEAREDTFHMRFVLNQPLFGEVFGYEGTFQVISCPQS